MQESVHLCKKLYCNDDSVDNDDTGGGVVVMTMTSIIALHDVTNARVGAGVQRRE